MQKLAVSVMLLALILSCARSGSAQSREQVEALQRENEALKGVLSLQKELEALREGQRSMQKDLEELKTLLRSRLAATQPTPTIPQNVVFNIEKEPFKGDKTAKLALIEFTDYQ